MKVQVRNLVRRYGAMTAVDDISFGFHEGQVFGFVGPNGAGKTTTMRIMATLDEPTSGDVLIDGISTVQQPELARARVGFVPDSLPAHRDMTCHEYLDFFARAHGIIGARRHSVVAEVEAFTGVDKMREKVLGHLSKGMKQRVSLARALIHDPDLLIMDEPAAGLDPKARIELRELIQALAANGKAIFISSHILDELGELCDGVVIIEQGRLVRAGHIDELMDDPLTGDRRTLWLRTLDDPDASLKAVLERPEVLGAVRVDREIRLELPASDEVGADLLKSLIEQGVRVVEFRRERRDLESVFMQVTRGEVQ